MTTLATEHQAPLVWCIGGLDPTGLAGISADNRALTAIGAYGVNIITTVTAQNSQRFIGQQYCPSHLLEQQWQALAEQCPPQVIKIGMLASSAQVLWLAEKLQQAKKQHATLWVIYDPVLKASSDNTPLANDLLEAIRQHLLPQVDLLTPNIPEALKLMATPPAAIEQLADFTLQIATRFNCQVLLKGGHIAEINTEQNQSFIDYYARSPQLTGTDYLAEPASHFAISKPASKSPHRRGSGCILASLIAGLVASSYTFADAIIYSSAILQKAYQEAQPLGLLTGGATKLTAKISVDNLPSILCFDQQAASDFTEHAFAPCPNNLGLYPVVADIVWLEKLLDLGVKTIQLRAKDLSQQAAEPIIKQAIALGKQYQARVFINDYWQLAIKHQAYGVHLGQEDLVSADLSAIKQAGLRLGLSTHGLFEACWAAQFKPSYLALGHIFATQTKDMPSKPQGLHKLARQVDIFTQHVPLTCIGGINLTRAEMVAATGIKSIALVTAITQAQTPEATTKQLLAMLGAGGNDEH